MEDNQEILDNITESLKSVPCSDSYAEFTNEYQLLETIGEGGFGKVKKGIIIENNIKVAIKFINESKITNWFYDKNMKRYIPLEIALMCHCKSIKGVVKILKYYYLNDQKGWFIIMERFDDYIDLFDYITNMGQINECIAADFLAQLIDILMNCHNNGICHRDIKDENIILNLTTMKISLIDFGAGGILHGDYYTEFDGTRVYSPPEWILKKQYQAVSLETWSIGILLYDMVCGNLPFDNDESISNGPLTFRRPISRHCQNLIKRCLARNPEKRITMSDILSHNWITQFSKKIESSINDDNNNNNNNNNNIDINNNNIQQPRRVSVDTTPFSTPQSSGLDDSPSPQSQSLNGLIPQSYLIPNSTKILHFTSPKLLPYHPHHQNNTHNYHHTHHQYQQPQKQYNNNNNPHFYSPKTYPTFNNNNNNNNNNNINSLADHNSLPHLCTLLLTK